MQTHECSLCCSLESKDTDRSGPNERTCWLLFRMSVLNQLPGGKHRYRDSYGRFAADSKSGDNTSLGEQNVSCCSRWFLHTHLQRNATGLAKTQGRGSVSNVFTLSSQSERISGCVAGWNDFMPVSEFLDPELGYTVDETAVFSASFHIIKVLLVSGVCPHQSEAQHCCSCRDLPGGGGGGGGGGSGGGASRSMAGFNRITDSWPADAASCWQESLIESLLWQRKPQ